MPPPGKLFPTHINEKESEAISHHSSTKNELFENTSFRTESTGLELDLMDTPPSPIKMLAVHDLQNSLDDIMQKIDVLEKKRDGPGVSPVVVAYMNTTIENLYKKLSEASQ